MQKNNFLQNPNVWLVFAILMLIPTIFFPFTCDQSIYVMAGKAIAEGKKIYIDFIDLKPAFAYYVYYAISRLFGYSEIGIRLFDFIFQSIIIFLIQRAVIKHTKDKLVASIAPIIYAFLYVIAGPAHSLQTEIFASFGFALVQYYSSNNGINLKRAILFGLVAGLITGIKYPYGILFVSLIFEILFENKPLKEKIQLLATLSVSYIFGFIVTLFPLLDKEVFDAFWAMQPMIKGYASRPAINTEWIKFIYMKTSTIFADNFSILISGSMILGVFHVFLKKKEYNKFYLSVLNIGLFFFISILVEKKLTDYYFIRLFPFMSIFSAIGISWVISVIKQTEVKFNPKIIFLSGLLFAFLVIYSPFARYAFRTISMIDFFKSKEQYYKRYENAGFAFNIVQYIEVTDRVNSMALKNKNLLYINVATGGNLLNYYSDKAKHSAFAMAQFYSAIDAVPYTKNKFLKELEQADLISFENSDTHPMLTGHELSSYGYFIEKPFNTYGNKVKNYVVNNFELMYSTTNVKLFKRKIDLH